MGKSITKEEQEKKQRQQKLKKLYTRYNQCRDAELDRFWKNSVFVWVFLALCFSGLGVLIFDHYTHYDCQKLHRGLLEDYYYLFALLISVFGLVLSNIWVWMARGLKAWYEVYEMAIWRIESQDNVFDYPHNYTIDNFWVIKETKNRCQKSVMSSASFSPSKIVILIGRLLTIIWFSVLCTYSYNKFNCEFYFDITKPNGWFFLTIGLTLIVIYLAKFLVQSSTLLTDGEKEVRQLIKKEIVKILEKKGNTLITEKDAYQFVFQNTYQTTEHKIKNCIAFVAAKMGIPLTDSLSKDVYQIVFAKVAKLNDYGIVSEVVSALTSKTPLKYSIDLSIVRFLCFRYFIIDIKVNNGSQMLIDLDKDFECLKNNVDSKYFIVKHVEKVNERRIRVRCRAKNWKSDLFNCDIYNLHDEESLINN